MVGTNLLPVTYQRMTATVPLYLQVTQIFVIVLANIYFWKVKAYQREKCDALDTFVHLMMNRCHFVCLIHHYYEYIIIILRNLFRYLNNCTRLL